MSMDDWGCGASFGESKSLTELVEGLSAKKVQEPQVDSLPFSLAEAENAEVEVIPCVIRSKGGSAPKILKKKSSINKINKEPNLKKVTFEVEQLLARESTGADKEEVTERLVVSLGGMPAKKKAIGYKQLKSDRARAKEEAKSSELSCLPNRVIKKKKK